MKFKIKKLLVIGILAILVIPAFNASDIPETACPNIYDFSNVEPGDGGQDYITDVQVGLSPGAEPGPFNIDLYDWLGNYIESTYYDADIDYSVLTGTDEPPAFTGLVDGTYTFIINDTYKGTFNVNHEMQGILNIDMSKYNQCNHDASGSYIDPNTIYYYDNEGNYLDPSSSESYDDEGNYLATKSIGHNNETSESGIETNSEVENDKSELEASQVEAVNQKIHYIKIVSVLVIGLFAVICVLLLIIYKMKKNK